MLDYYDLLGVTADSSRQEIQTCYRQRIRTLHPDRFTEDPSGLLMAGQMSGLLNLAWETLSRPAARAEYDRRLRHDGTAVDAATDRRTDDARLVEALDEAARRVPRIGEIPGGVTELSRSLRAAALSYRARSAPLDDGADALAVVAAFRDAAADGSLGPQQLRTLSQIAGRAVELLGAQVPLRSRSWLERGVRAAVPASTRQRVAQAVSRAGLALVAVAALAAGIDLHDGHGTPWLPFTPDGAAPTRATAAAGTTLLIALALAAATLVASRVLGAGARAAVPAQPTVSVHLDAVDRIRFAAGRRFRTLPEREPAPEPTDP